MDQITPYRLHHTNTRVLCGFSFVFPTSTVFVTASTTARHTPTATSSRSSSRSPSPSAGPLPHNTLRLQLPPYSSTGPVSAAPAPTSSLPTLRSRGHKHLRTVDACGEESRYRWRVGRYGSVEWRRGVVVMMCSNCYSAAAAASAQAPPCVSRLSLSPVHVARSSQQEPADTPESAHTEDMDLPHITTTSPAPSLYSVHAEKGSRPSSPVADDRPVAHRGYSLAVPSTQATPMGSGRVANGRTLGLTRRGSRESVMSRVSNMTAAS